jgi:hypothetical protein
MVYDTNEYNQGKILILDFFGGHENKIKTN